MPVGDNFQVHTCQAGAVVVANPRLAHTWCVLSLPLSALLHRMLDGAWCLSPEGPYRTLEVGGRALAGPAVQQLLALPAVQQLLALLAESPRPASQVCAAAPYSAPRLTQPVAGHHVLMQDLWDTEHEVQTSRQE